MRNFMGSVAMNKQIVCVDDDPEILYLAEMLLADMGDTIVHTFTDAYAALKQIPKIKR